jgi:hypothetical protein
MRKLSPHCYNHQRLQIKNISEVSRGIQALTSKDCHKEQEILSWSLSRAVFYAQLDVAREGRRPDDSSTSINVGASQSAEVFQLFVGHGRDINQSEPDRGAGPGECLLQLVCNDESLSRWCLDDGASVEERHPDPYRCPPLLEIVASVGTVPTFTLLHSRGAQLGPCTLHRAVASAVYCESESRSVRISMVRNLVDELGPDINTLDTKEKMPNHWGTVVYYAGHAACDCEETVRFLLDRSADTFHQRLVENI